MIVEGRKRKLVINELKMSDNGSISCHSSADETSAELVVECKFLIILFLMGYYVFS